MNQQTQQQPAIISLQELQYKCSRVGIVDDTVMDLWKMCTPLPDSPKRILFPANFIKWAEQARLFQ